MIFLKKTRALGFSFAFSTLILFVGVTSLKHYYGVSISYDVNKKEEFAKSLQSGEEVSLNLVPSGWLQHIDGRGVNSIIPLKYRTQIQIAFPLGSAPGVKTFYCAEDDGFISYVTDRFGFRNEDDQWNYSAHDILILGDSFAESACIPTAFQTNFSENLKVVSLGKGGNGPLTSLATFIEYSNRFKVKKVYFLVVSNDYVRPKSSPESIDLERELLEPELRKYLVESNQIQDYFNEPYLNSYKTFAVDYSKSLAKNILKSSSQNFIRNVSNFFHYDFIKNILLSEKSAQKSLEHRFINRNELERVYQRAIHVAEKVSSKLVFVPLPDKASSCEKDEKKIFIYDVLTDLNADVIDIWSELCDKKFFAHNGGHFNKLGYKTLADRIEADFSFKRSSSAAR